MERIWQFLKWVTNRTLRFWAYGENTTTPHDVGELYKPRPPEYRP